MGIKAHPQKERLEQQMFTSSYIDDLQRQSGVFDGPPYEEEDEEEDDGQIAA